ncbi:MAG: FAD-dependent oxidoreductase [Candidatus Acidiferrales bacterium]
MARERLVVIGGVAAGMSAASRARRRNPQLEIIVLEMGRHVSYGACGLPWYLSGEIQDWKDLLVYSAEYFREKRGIDVRLAHKVSEIEPGRKLVHALREGVEEVSIAYDKLIITTGGAADVEIPGADLPAVFTCNDLSGAILFREFLETARPQRAVIVGSGYIGLEVAAALANRGIKVVVLERSETVLGGAEPEINVRVEDVLLNHGVRLLKKTAVSSIAADGAGTGLHVLHSQGSESAEIVVLATGIHPRVALAESARIQLGPTGAIAVDERMHTSVSSIHAAGDCVEARHLVSGRPVYFPLGTTANKQGRVAGENAAGGHARFAGIVGTLATKVFELEVARTGLSVAEARSAGFHPDSIAINSTSRAYYFHGRPLMVKLIWDRADGRLLGCQMCGEEGIAKRIDVAAMALHARMRIPEMLHLDLSYAPPFAPVWEAILVAANEAMKKLSRD